MPGEKAFDEAMASMRRGEAISLETFREDRARSTHRRELGSRSALAKLAHQC